jgi:hypothetical protein
MENNVKLLGQVENGKTIVDFIRDNYNEEILESVSYCKEDEIFSLQDNWDGFSDNMSDSLYYAFNGLNNEFIAHITDGNKAFITDINNKDVYFYKELHE